MNKKILLLFLTLTPLAPLSFRDSVKSLGGANAIEMVELWRMITANLTYDDRAKQFFSYMNSALENFDFNGVYESSWLTEQGDGFRSIMLAGKNNKHQYYVSIADPKAKPTLNQLGDTIVDYRLKKNAFQNDRTFAAQLSLQAALKQYNAHMGLTYLESLLHVIDPTNIAKSSASEVSLFPLVSNESKKVTNLFSVDFPATANFLNRYTQLKSLAEIKQHKNGAYTHFTMRASVNMAALAETFPDLKKFFKNIKDLFIISFNFQNSKGQQLMKVAINAETEEFQWEFLTQGGKIIPFDHHGTPQFSESFSLTKINNYKFSVIANIFINVHGLKMEINNVETALRFKNQGSESALSGKITQIPEGKVSGALFGVIPTWLIDLSIPSNLQELMNRFSQTMMSANDGEGTRLSLAWHGSKKQTIMTAKATTEFLDNTFIRIGMKIWVKKFRPNESVQDDIRKFLAEFTGMLLADLRAMR